MFDIIYRVNRGIEIGLALILSALWFGVAIVQVCLFLAAVWLMTPNKAEARFVIRCRWRDFIQDTFFS